MTKRTRETLKQKFMNGEMPSMNGFSDLIDSMLNMLEDGFDKTPADGFKVAQLQDGRLISFYKDIDVRSPLWSIRLDTSAEKSLIFGSNENPNALTLRNLANVEQPGGMPRTGAGIGINKAHPRYELDVAGTVASHGRIGRKGELPVPADSEWHDITDALDGCYAFEIMAGVGKKGSGKYTIMHAFALNAFNSKSHITYHQAFYSSKCCRLELRWEPVSGGRRNEYKLQMRVGCSYGEGVWVQYYITSLWPDPFMDDCLNKPVVAKAKK